MSDDMISEGGPVSQENPKITGNSIIFKDNDPSEETTTVSVEMTIERGIRESFIIEDEPTVTAVNTEVANFSDKSLVLRQRSYMNRSFASLRNKHEILTPDVFRMVFKVGRTLPETLKYFQSPELMEDESQVDGDPGDSRKRMLRP